MALTRRSKGRSRAAPLLAGPSRLLDSFCVPLISFNSSKIPVSGMGDGGEKMKWHFCECKGAKEGIRGCTLRIVLSSLRKAYRRGKAFINPSDRCIILNMHTELQESWTLRVGSAVHQPPALHREPQSPPAALQWSLIIAGAWKQVD